MSAARISWLEVVLLVAIVAMIVVIAVPGIVRNRRAVNEEEAVGALRTLDTVEASFYNRHPATGFTCSLDELYKEGLIDARLASGARSGYRLTGTGCRSGNPKAQTITEYQWFADPITPATGTRHFCTDNTKVVRASDTQAGQSCLVMGAEL
jgi:type II secretory pathway pseudopilin PulG